MGRMDKDEPVNESRLTANQVVAHNLRAARELRGLTQAQAAEALERFTGERWSVPVFSTAERSITGTRIRVFDADLIHAFARAFELPIGFFFLPPDGATSVGLDDARYTPAAPREQISLATWTSDEIRARVDEVTQQLPPEERARLLRGVVDSDPGGVRETAVLDAVVAQVRPQLAALVAELQAQIDVLDALSDEEAGDDQGVEVIEVDLSRGRGLRVREGAHLRAGNKPQG